MFCLLWDSGLSCSMWHVYIDWHVALCAVEGKGTLPLWVNFRNEACLLARDHPSERPPLPLFKSTAWSKVDPINVNAFWLPAHS